jgi:hypothetical protein
MRRPVGIYLTAGAMLLTYLFHICIASVALGTPVAKLVVPKPYQDLVGIAFLAAGFGLMALLIIGIFSYNRLALRISAIVFLGGTVGSILWSGDYHRRLDIIICFGVTGICLASAGYLWRLARKLAVLPPKLLNQVGQVDPNESNES